MEGEYSVIPVLDLLFGAERYDSFCVLGENDDIPVCSLHHLRIHLYSFITYSCKTIAMKNAVFWDMMTPYSSCKDSSFGGTRTRTTRLRPIHEDGILHCYRSENFKSYTVSLYGRLIITYDKVTAYQLHLHGNR
jgi:hypothetical protein